MYELSWCYEIIWHIIPELSDMLIFPVYERFWIDLNFNMILNKHAVLTHGQNPGIQIVCPVCSCASCGSFNHCHSEHNGPDREQRMCHGAMGGGGGGGVVGPAACTSMVCRSRLPAPLIQPHIWQLLPCSQHTTHTHLTGVCGCGVQ